MISIKNKLSAIALACATIGFSQLAMADDSGTPAGTPSTQPSAVAVQQRTIQEILPEFQSVRKDVHKVMPDPILNDAQKRMAVAPKAIELLNREYKLLLEMEATKKIPSEQIAQLKQGTQAELYLLKDTQTTTEVDAMVAGKDATRQIDGQAIQILSQWTGTDDRTAINKLVAQTETLDKAHPENSQLTLLTINMSQTTDVQEVSDKLDSLIADTMTDPYAKRAKAQILAQREAMAKQLAFKDKPLEIAAKTVDGKDFTTAAWKGKVVLVDYWATWCGPCKEGLPHVKEIYNQYHDRGLEIVGVSNDYTAKALQDFTPANNMPWPQLLDADAAAKNSWNPITLDHGIRGIPTMWLIDKKGILRSITAREEMDTLIPKLLAE